MNDYRRNTPFPGHVESGAAYSVLSLERILMQGTADQPAGQPTDSFLLVKHKSRSNRKIFYCGIFNSQRLTEAISLQHSETAFKNYC